MKTIKFDLKKKKKKKRPIQIILGHSYFWGSFLDTSSLATGYSRRSIDTWTFAPTVVSARQGVIYLSAL